MKRYPTKQSNVLMYGDAVKLLAEKHEKEISRLKSQISDLKTKKIPKIKSYHERQFEEKHKDLIQKDNDRVSRERDYKIKIRKLEYEIIAKIKKEEEYEPKITRLEQKIAKIKNTSFWQRIFCWNKMKNL